MKGYGQRLKEVRGNIPRKTAAKELGISLSALSMYEREERFPRPEIIQRIASYYNRPAGYIFLENKDTKQNREGERKKCLLKS